MTDTYRDTIIRRALTPADDVHVPPGLAHEIARLARSTPQEQPRPRVGLVRRSTGLRLSPAVVLLLLLGALTGLAIAAALLRSVERTGPGDVLRYHGNAGLTGEVVGPGPVGVPVIEWDVPSGRELLWSTMPLLDEEIVYAVDLKGGAFAVDAATGDERWRTSLGAEVGGTPFIADETLIVGSRDGAAVALSLTDGLERWRTTLPSPVTSSVMGWEDLALLGTEDGSLHALDVASGIERWSVKLAGSIEQAAAIEDALAYVPLEGSGLTAVDLRIGAATWSLELPGHTVFTPAVRDGTLYVSSGVDGSLPYELVAFDTAPLREGSPPLELWRWLAPTSEQSFVGAVSADTVYATSNDGNVYALDRTDGEGRLLLDTNGQVGALAMLVDDTLYVSSTDRHVYAIDRHTGDPDWIVEVPGDPTIPVVSDGRVIVGTSLGRLVSLASTDGAPD